MKKVFLNRFQKLYPPKKNHQDVINQWVIRAHQQSSQLTKASFDLEKLKKYLISSEDIHTRYSFCLDVDRNWEDSDIYRLCDQSPYGATIKERADYFQNQALNCIKNFYQEATLLPQHLIHVTCTGYISPSAPQVYFADVEKAPAITHAYHMGCYASLPAVRLGQSLVSSEQFQNVDLIHTEMCSLHMQPQIHTAEQMIVQSLFADGTIKYQISDESADDSFELLFVHEKLIPNSSKDMTWISAPYGMQMSLTRDVPTKIALGLDGFIQAICQKLNLGWDELKANSLFAIHPGGPKILDLTSELLQLQPEQIQASYEILKEHGNMSSATLPHIWQRLLTIPKNKKYVLSMAFGPGLTIFGSVMKRI